MFPRNSIIIVAAPQPTAIIQQNHINSNSKRARVCDCERGKFATQVVLFSVHVMALGSANREVNMTARCSSWRELAISSALNKHEAFVFELAFFLLLGTAQTKLRKPQQQWLQYVPKQQNSLQSALHRAAKYIQYK